MNKKSIAIALIVTIIFGVLFFYSFLVWKERALSTTANSNRISAIEKMEKDGLPYFSSTDINGEKIVFNNNLNKLKIVNFWASWCEPCIAEVPSLIELVKAFPDQIEVFAISGDNSIDDVNAFLKAFPGMKNKNIHIILDQQQKIMNLYGTDRLPESFISDKSGRLVKKIVGSINWHTKESEAFIQGILSR